MAVGPDPTVMVLGGAAAPPEVVKSSDTPPLPMPTLLSRLEWRFPGAFNEEPPPFPPPPDVDDVALFPVVEEDDETKIGGWVTIWLVGLYTTSCTVATWKAAPIVGSVLVGRFLVM